MRPADGSGSSWGACGMSARFVALVAGVVFFFLAVVTQGILPFIEPSARTTDVTAVVRTDFGQLKWMMTEATDYTPQQQLGRNVYLREGCWYCHSQYVRPVTGETRRWGPVSEAGEYAFDVPHLLGTRRIGPDLTRVGLKYSDEWHLAHFWNPRMLSPDSIMAPYRGPVRGRPRSRSRSSTMRSGNRDAGKNAGHREAVRLREQGADQAHAERRWSPVRAAGSARQGPDHCDTEQGIYRRHRQDRRRDERARRL